MDHQLFVYGTLLDSAVQRAVIGREVPGNDARLESFRKTAIKDGSEVFPNLVPDPKGNVDGRVLEVSEEELARIDCYEGDLYVRHCVTVTDGPEVWVYHS